MSKREEREANFILQSKARWADQIDYTPLIGNFVNQNTKVSMRCIKHDEVFTTFPTNHLKGKGSGCRLCKTIVLSKSGSKTVPEGRCSSCKNISHM